MPTASGRSVIGQRTRRRTAGTIRTGPELLEIITAVDGDRWFSGGEAVAYGLADEMIGGPAGTPESGPPV